VNVNRNLEEVKKNRIETKKVKEVSAFLTKSTPNRWSADVFRFALGRNHQQIGDLAVLLMF